MRIRAKIVLSNKEFSSKITWSVPVCSTFMLFAITRLETVKVFITSQRMLLKIKLVIDCCSVSNHMSFMFLSVTLCTWTSPSMAWKLPEIRFRLFEHTAVAHRKMASPGYIRSAQYLRSEATTAIEPSLKKVFERKRGTRERVDRSSEANETVVGRLLKRNSAMAVLTITAREVARVASWIHDGRRSGLVMMMKRLRRN